MKNTVRTFQMAKEKGEKLTMLTAYDYSTARLMEEAGINAILVGDSLGNTILGYEDTISVTVDDMIHHGAAVARGTSDTMVVIDMPFMSYQTGTRDALINAGRLMKEGRAGAVKLEGGASVCPQIKAITEAGIPVMAHLGLTPQSVNAFGGNRVQGKTEAAAKKLIEAGEEGLKECKTGFRAPYIMDACRRFDAGELDEKMLRGLDYESVMCELMKVHGIGEKVANCIALFGLSKRNAFPVDVWIKRIMEELYIGHEADKKEIGRLAQGLFGEYGGYAQQYLFYYGKELKIGKETKNQ